MVRRDGEVTVGRVLFFTPVLPGVTGQGTAIRCGVALELLSEKHLVTVVHVDLWNGDQSIVDREWPRQKAAAYHFVPTPIATHAAEQLVQQHLSKTTFDALYVYRLVAAPLALRVMTLLGQRPQETVLDLDDDEYTRTEKFFALRDAGADPERVKRERAELQRLRGFVRLMLPRFDLGLLASAEDVDSMAAQYPEQKFALLPNVMRIPDELTPAAPNRAGSLLFIGTLDYLPNEDGVLYFTQSILPRLLASARHVDLRVVGIKTPKSIENLRGHSGITVVGAVKDVAHEYAKARMLVVPLRAGSGTRIKILEAFRFGVPVVSTSIGAAGLAVCHGVHLLIANTPEEFAAACQRLMDDDQLAAMLAANAREWLQATHSMERARRVLHGLFSGHDDAVAPAIST
jgi:glycosyltransferase involved in cell wall biosynthesis